MASLRAPSPPIQSSRSVLFKHQSPFLAWRGINAHASASAPSSPIALSAIIVSTNKNAVDAGAEHCILWFVVQPAVK